QQIVTAILRSKKTRELFGVAKTAFHDNFVWHPGSPDIVAGTKAVPRLRPAMINGKVRGYFEDEVVAVIEGIRAQRDAGWGAETAPGNAEGKFVESNKPRGSKKPTSARFNNPAEARNAAT